MVLATGNEHKAEEFEDLFAGSKFKVFSAAKFGGMPKVIENGKTFFTNFTNYLCGSTAYSI